jgi:hypothetical protein
MHSITQAATHLWPSAPVVESGGAHSGTLYGMPDGTPRRARFFLSHSMKDQAVVELLKQQIDALGVELYLAEHDPQPGRLLADKVSEAIGRSDAVVVLLTANGAAAPFVQQEIGIARHAGKLVVPIVQEGIGENALAMLAGSSGSRWTSESQPRRSTR